MDYSGKAPGIFLHNLHGVGSGLPAVDQNRKSQLSCKLKLADKPFLLYIVRFMIPVIIQADLPYCNHFLPLCLLPYLNKRLHVKLSHFVRMNPYRRIHKGIILHHIYNPPAGF